jgi:hypothetical protein
VRSYFCVFRGGELIVLVRPKCDTNVAGAVELKKQKSRAEWEKSIKEVKAASVV